MKRKNNIIYQKDLVSSVQGKTGLSKEKLRKFLSVFKRSIIESLANSEPVRIKSFGAFDVKSLGERKCYSIREQRTIYLPPKKLVRFKKSKSWSLPSPLKRKTRSANATKLQKKSVPYSLSRKTINCDTELVEFYKQLIVGRSNCFPYIWKMRINKEEYTSLKGLLSWALEEYEYEGIDYRNLLKKHANLVAIYIAEWYKRDYKNNRGDENNDALRELDLPGKTSDYNLVWQYSSSAFNIEKFLYGTKLSNRTKHSLYILGGIPLQFESKKLRAIIFNTLNTKNSESINDDEIQVLNESEKAEDDAFLIENMYLRESLTRKDGSLHLYVEELKNGTYIDDVKDDEDYALFVDNYLNFQQQYFCKNKFRSEWLIYHKTGTETIGRELIIHLGNEYSNEGTPNYISGYRLKRWNIPSEEFDDFDIVLKLKNGKLIRLFRFSYSEDNNFVCKKSYKRIEDVPCDFEKGELFLKPVDSDVEYKIPEKEIVFDDVIRLLKTTNAYEWTNNPYVNSTEVALLCTQQYKPVGQEIPETIYLSNGDIQKAFYWIPFNDMLTLRNIITGEETNYTSKTGRLSISLKSHDKGLLHKTVPAKVVDVRNSNGTYRKVPIFRKSSESKDLFGINKDRFVFEEYDMQRGILKSKTLEKEEGVRITIHQNGTEYIYPIDLCSLTFGLFTIKCSKQNHYSVFEAFCIENSDDIVRNFNEETFVFSGGLYNGLGKLVPLNDGILKVGKHAFKEDVSIDCGQETVVFRSHDDSIRIPVFRVSAKAYVAYFKGVPEIVPHYSKSQQIVLFVPKHKQADITRIDVIDKEGVRGVDISDVYFRHIILKEVYYSFSPEGYGINIPDNTRTKYSFINYDTSTKSMTGVKPLQIGNSYWIKCSKESLIIQLSDRTNEPDYLFTFKRNNADIGLKRLLCLNQEEEKAFQELPLFLYAFCKFRNFQLSKKDYEFLINIAEELEIDWMFLYPKSWKMKKFPREILYKLFLMNKPASESVESIANTILDGISDHAKWVEHRVEAQKGIGYDAVEMLMPIHVQKGRKRTSIKNVNTKNADKVREVDLDIRNISVAREISFTGKLRNDKFISDFLENLHNEDSYDRIYEYMKKFNLIK